MRYITGSIIISFGILFVVIVVLNAAGVKAPKDVMQYLGIAWVVLAIISYPIARKIMSDEE